MDKFQPGELIVWDARVASERTAQQRFPGPWQIKYTGTPAAGRYKQTRCVFIFPPQRPDLARWVPLINVHRPEQES